MPIFACFGLGGLNASLWLKLTFAIDKIILPIHSDFVTLLSISERCFMPVDKQKDSLETQPI